MSLSTYTDQLRRFLLEGGEPGPLLTLDPPTRIGVYANAYSILKETVLGALFPRLKASAGAERWERLKRDYFLSFPPSSWEINANAARFPEFVAAQADLPAFASQLASYEWTDFALSLVAEEVTASGPLRLNPTVTFKEFDWDFATWLQPTCSAATPEPGAVSVILYRHPLHERTWCRPASAETLLALKLVDESVPPSAYGTITGLPEAAVRAHVLRGLSEGWLLGEFPPTS